MRAVIEVCTVWRERTSIEINRFERRGLAIDTRSAEFFARPTEKKQTGPATRIFITFSLNRNCTKLRSQLILVQIDRV